MINENQTTKTADSTLEPLGNVPLSQLPQRFQDCFDKSKTPDLEYFKVKSKSGFDLIIAAIACIVFLVFLGQAINTIFIEEHVEKQWAMFSLGWCVIFLFPAIFSLRFAIRKHTYKSGIDSGDSRVGLIIHPEALLVRLNRKSYYLIPRNWLSAVTVQRYLHANRLSATKIVFTDNEGKDYGNIIGINSFGVFDYFDHQGELADALRRWNPELTVLG